MQRGLRHCLLVFWGRRIGVGSRPDAIDRLAACGDYGHDPLHWGRGLRWLGWPLSRGFHRGSYPVVGGIVPVFRRAIRGRWVVVPAVIAWAVLFFPCGMAEMASDRTEVTVVPSVLMRSVRHACSCQGWHSLQDLVPSRLS